MGHWLLALTRRTESSLKFKVQYQDRERFRVRLWLLYFRERLLNWSKGLEQKPRQKGAVRLDLGQEDNRMDRLWIILCFFWKKFGNDPNPLNIGFWSYGKWEACLHLVNKFFANIRQFLTLQIQNILLDGFMRDNHLVASVQAEHHLFEV